MNNFKPSLYQVNILNAIRETNKNILVDAKAGSGKTSTLLLISDEIIKQGKKCLFLAFNKSIVTELQNRIQSNNVEIKTLHSLGLSFLRSYLFRKHEMNYELEIDQKDEKAKNYIEKYFNEYCAEDFKKSSAIANLTESNIKDIYNNIIRELTSMINYVRLYNINYKEPEKVFELGDKLCWELKDWPSYNLKNYPYIIRDTINKIKEDFENPIFSESGKPLYIISYTDMIYFPCLYGMTPPSSVRNYLDFILCDESQDLSVLQQHFLKLLKTYNNRYIFVGDEKQAIYGFAGADTSSINNLRKNFELYELPLNICYRCPENIIRLAQSLVPDIDWNHTREDKGGVFFIKEELLEDKVKPGDIIVGRRNKDLVKIYKHFVLDKHKSIKFKNLDMVNAIINEIKRVIKEYIKRYNQNLNVEKELAEICSKKKIDIKIMSSLTPKKKQFIEDTYKELIKNKKKAYKEINKKLIKTKYLKTCMQEYKEQGEYKYVTDDSRNLMYAEYYDIIESFLDEYIKMYGDTLVDNFVIYLEKFFKGNLDKDTPILSSVHMMKGGEADNVFILEYPRFPYKNAHQTRDMQLQEDNLQYVALTRPKKNLYLCKISKPRNNETLEYITKLNNECEVGVDFLLKIIGRC